MKKKHSNLTRIYPSTQNETNTKSTSPASYELFLLLEFSCLIISLWFSQFIKASVVLCSPHALSGRLCIGVDSNLLAGAVEGRLGMGVSSTSERGESVKCKRSIYDLFIKSAPFFGDLKNVPETKNSSKFYILKLYFLLHYNQFSCSVTSLL